MPKTLFYPSAESVLKQLRQLPVNRFVTDSRHVTTGDVFVCQTGQLQDGHDHIDEAISRGAIAILATRELDTPPSIPIFVLPNYTTALHIASSFCRQPQDQLYNIAVTGTNGKTTVAWSLAELLGKQAAYVGTLGCKIADQLIPVTNTTPDALTLLTMMQKMVKRRSRYQVMEVSSHALTQDRTTLISFDMVIFTNIGADHLDYHGSRDAYVAAKLSLLKQLRPKGKVIVNLDDESAKEIIGHCPTDAEIITYSLHDPQATLLAKTQRSDLFGSHFTLQHRGVSIPASTPLPFRYNLENSLAVLAALFAITDDLGRACQTLATLTAIPGRTESLRLSNGATAMVDYAHNRDGLESLLSQTRALLEPYQRIFLVAGLTGERLQDATATGALCSQLADQVWFTCHNPLGLPANAVPEAMLSHADKQHCRVVLDRQSAIIEAVSKLGKDDILLVCGKGRECYQYMNADKHQPQPYIGDFAAIERCPQQSDT